MSRTTRYLVAVYDASKRAEAIRWAQRLRSDIRTATRLGDAFLARAARAEYLAIKCRYNL